MAAPTNGLSPDRSGDDPVQALLDECLAAESSAWREQVAKACREHPEHADELRRRFAALEAAGMLDSWEQPTAAGGGGSSTGAVAFGGFELIEVLGQGGMGVVHRARQLSTGREVALKLIRPEFLGQEKARRRFQREIEAVSKLEHPGICTVYEAGEVDGVPYVAMRYIKGCTLAQLAGEQLTARGASETPLRSDTDSKQRVDSTLLLFEKIARALHAAHESGVLHRDVKPGNVMVDEQGEPVVLDFGLARPEEDTGEGLTASADQLGTPAYMSPEQIQGMSKTLDRRCDVYALGVTMYEVLAKKHPFVAPTREQLYRNVLAGRAPQLSREGRYISSDLSVVVHTAMSLASDHRYESAAAFADDLRRVRLLQPISAKRPGQLQRFARWCQREPIVAALLAALLVIAVGSAWLAVDANRSRRAAELAGEGQKTEAENARQQAENAKLQAERARQESVTSQRVSDFLVELFKVADGSTYRGTTVTAREVLDQGYRRIEQELKDEPEIKAKLMATMGVVYQHLGLFDRAKEMFAQSLQLREAHDAGPRELAVSQRNLGELAHFREDFEAAEQRYREAEATLAKIHVGADRDYAKTLDLLGRVRRDQGDFVGAESYHQRSFAMRQQLEDNALVLSDSHQSLGMLANYRGDAKAALPHWLEAIALCKSALGPQSGQMPELLQGLGLTYHHLGRTEEAKTTLRVAMDLTREVFGESHQGVGFCFDTLGGIAADEGNREEAMRCYSEARAIFAKFFGEVSRAVAIEANNYGVLANELQKWDEAKDSLQDALAIRIKLFGEKHADVAWTLSNLGVAHERSGDVDGALRHFQRSYEVFRQALGKESPEAQSVVARIIRMLEGKGSPELSTWRARLLKK